MSSSSSGAADPRKRRNIIIGAAIAVAVVVAVIIVLVSSGGSDSSGNDAAGGGSGTIQVKGVKEMTAMLDGIPQDGNALGKKSAKVTLIEFADYQCPFCRDFALNTLPVIINDFVRPGKVRMELRTLTFIGPDSETAARAGAAAGEQNLEWNFTDLFYYNQGQENSGYVTDDFIDSLYKAAGVDVAKANAFRKTDAAAVPAQSADAEAQKYGIQSTPSFVVGPTGGPYTKLDVDISNPDGFKAALNSLLKK
ncbi:MAG: thioredoxin domain-containing protein [Acidobacteria bacterium]|nr:thioredoxin domain-containing protein [Acidobacteriota bacterium]